MQNIPRHLELLRVVADYRVLTMEQLSSIQGRPPKAMHDSADRLARKGLLEKQARTRPARRGRRESLVAVTVAGFQALAEAETLPADAREKDVTLAGLPHIEHQLLLNQVRIQWGRLDRICPALRTWFVPHSSPTARYQVAGSGAETRPVPVSIPANGRQLLTPDAVATIADVERNRTVLFFVEADRGTEQRNASGGPRPTIAGKIEKYQRAFRSGRYRDYETVCGCELRGFRVLFVVDSVKRFTSLCHHLDGVSPREFIWITDVVRLRDHGAGAPIWARGGHQDRPPASILGSRAPNPVTPLDSPPDPHRIDRSR